MSLIRNSLTKIARPTLALGYKSAALSTSAIRFKTLSESVKETADNVNKKVGETLAAGLENAQQATQAAKNTVASKAPSASDVNAKTESVRQNTNQALGTAAGKAQEATDKAAKGVQKNL